MMLNSGIDPVQVQGGMARCGQLHMANICTYNSSCNYSSEGDINSTPIEFFYLFSFYIFFPRVLSELSEFRVMTVSIMLFIYISVEKILVLPLSLIGMKKIKRKKYSAKKTLTRTFMLMHLCENIASGR